MNLKIIFAFCGFIIFSSCKQEWLCTVTTRLVGYGEENFIDTSMHRHKIVIVGTDKKDQYINDYTRDTILEAPADIKEFGIYEYRDSTVVFCQKK